MAGSTDSRRILGFWGGKVSSADRTEAGAPDPSQAATNTSLRSTASQAQRDRMLDMLRTGQRSTFDFRRAGVMQSSTRVHELRRQGHNIVTVARRDLFDADGFRHERVAVYALLDEPARVSSHDSRAATP